MVEAKIQKNVRLSTLTCVSNMAAGHHGFRMIFSEESSQNKFGMTNCNPESTIGVEGDHRDIRYRDDHYNGCDSNHHNARTTIAET